MLTEKELMMLDPNQKYTYKFLVRMMPDQIGLLDKYVAKVELQPTQMMEIAIAIRDGLEEDSILELSAAAVGGVDRDRLRVHRHEMLCQQLLDMQLPLPEEFNALPEQIRQLQQMQQCLLATLSGTMKSYFGEIQNIIEEEKKLQEERWNDCTEQMERIVKAALKGKSVSGVGGLGWLGIKKWTNSKRSKKIREKEDQERMKIIHGLCQQPYNLEQFAVLTEAASNPLITTEELELLGNTDITAEQMQRSVDLLIKMRSPDPEESEEQDEAVHNESQNNAEAEINPKENPTQNVEEKEEVYDVPDEYFQDMMPEADMEQMDDESNDPNVQIWG